MAEAPQLINPISPNAEISDDFNGLLPLLQRLDRLIQKAVAAFQSHEEGALKLSSLQQTDISAFDNTSVQIREDSTLAWLQKTFELSAFDLDLLALSIAPELDRQYVRIYAYLQDDITQKRPTVDLALNLFCSTNAEKFSYRKHFTNFSPLISHRLLHLFAESQPQQASLLEHRFSIQKAGLIYC